MENLSYLKELQEVATQNLIAATQENIELQLSLCNFEDSPNTTIKETVKEKQTKKCRKVYSCHIDGCGRQFKWLSHFKYHQRAHHLGSRPYHCEHKNCNFSFYTRQSLSVHARTHSDSKLYICPEKGCAKGFHTLGNLRNHLRTHTGERPYICPKESCKRNFAEKSSLKKHMLVHSGEKPFTCDICGKVFSQIGSRNVHKRRAHQSEDDLNCDDAPSTSVSVEMENYIMLSDDEANKMFTMQSLTGDCVILSQPISDHLVTVASNETENEEFSYQTVLSPSNANVLVLHEPQEMVMISIKDIQNSNIFQDLDEEEEN